jgi:predicted DNA-binding transcriptional regulator AlpA
MSATEDRDPPNLAIVSALATDTDGVSTTAPLIDEAALAGRLGISRSTLQSWRYAGRGPRFIKLGRLVRYRVSDVDAYLVANTRGRLA